jgi:hypothetical protein
MVVLAMPESASAVKKAWCAVMSTLGKVSRAGVASGREVDVVEARGPQGHQACPSVRQRPQDPLVDLVVDEDTDGVMTAGQRDLLTVEPGLEEVESMVGARSRSTQVANVIGLGGEDGHAHGPKRGPAGRVVVSLVVPAARSRYPARACVSPKPPSVDTWAAAWCWSC